MPALQSVLNKYKSPSSYLLFAPGHLLPIFSHWVIYQLNILFSSSLENLVPSQPLAQHNSHRDIVTHEMSSYL